MITGCFLNSRPTLVFFDDKGNMEKETTTWNTWSKLIVKECALDHEFFGWLFHENCEILWTFFQNPEPEIFYFLKGTEEVLRFWNLRVIFFLVSKIFETHNRRFSTKSKNCPALELTTYWPPSSVQMGPLLLLLLTTLW